MKNNKEELKHLSDYYVLYIDILGATNFINSDKNEIYLNCLYELYNDTFLVIKLLNNNLITKKDIKVKIFSDNIVVAIKKSNDIVKDIDQRLFLTYFSAYIQILAIKYEMLTRGSIVIGKFYIDNDFVYGSALTSAYNLEQNIAIYPRIVIDKDFLNIIELHKVVPKYIYKDSSETIYINPFEAYLYVAQKYEHYELKIIHDVLSDRLNETKNIKHLQKINWLINEFNDFCHKNNCMKYIVQANNMELENAK